MGNVTDPGCIYYEETSDDAEHTFFYCIKRQNDKNTLIEQFGDNIMNAMLESESKWSVVRRYVECVLHIKKVNLDAVRYFSDKLLR